MNVQLLKTVSKRSATVVGAVVITAVVISGGLSVAQAATEAVANNSVNSAKIVNNSIQSVDILDNTLTGADIGNNAVGTFEIADGNVNNADLNPLLRPRWAKVGAGVSPTLLAQRGATGVTRQAAGAYDVTFASAITGCGWIATRNDNDAGGVTPGEIAVERASAGNPNTLRIRTYNSSGSQVDPEAGDGFTVSVVC